MSSFHGPRLLTLAGLACLTSVSAFAQPEAGTPYLGLSAGQAKSSFDEARIAGSLLAPGVSTSTLSEDTRGKAFKVFGGYQVNRNLALEAGYFDLGRFGFTATTVPPGSLDGRLKVSGFNLDLVGTLPLTDSLSALGRVGAQRAKTKSDFSASGAALPTSAPRSETSTNAKFGVGLQYAFSPSMLMRGEVERYRVPDTAGNRANVNVASLSLVFPFGRAQASRPVATYVAPPVPIVMAPEPAPPPAPPVVVVMAAPPAVVAPPAPRRVSFSAESLFGFDKSALRPEGMTALDTFSKELAGSQYDTITVEGHTDRIGSPAYNQTLSMQRADVVKGYLVTAGHIDATKVSAQGKGEMVPVTKPEDCKGNAATAKLIACLQPDRRVDIEVVGTR